MIAAGLAGYTEKRGQGAKQLQINKAKWVSFLKDERYGLSKERAEQTLKRFDVEALVNGIAQRDSKRYDYHLVRLGDRESDTYTSNISKQKIGKKLITAPPVIPSLRAKQRALSRGSQDIIADIIVHNEDVFHDAIRLGRTFPKVKAKTRKTSVAAAAATPSPPKKKQRVSVIGLVHSPPQFSIPTPKAIRATPPSAQAVQQTQSPLAKEGDLLQAAIAQVTGATNADYSTVEARSALDRLLTQCIAMKQKLDGDSVVLKYNDHRNNQQATFVRVPRNTSEAAALKQSGFWEKVHEINEDGCIAKSAKRAAKHFRKHYADAFNEFLEEEGISSRTVM